VQVGAEGAYGRSQVLMAACGYCHTLAMTKVGNMWVWGNGA